jgi:integrase
VPAKVGAAEMRVSSRSALRWDEIIANAIHLSGARTKNGEAHIIPLSTAARAIIDGLPKDGAFVFPGPSGSVPASSYPVALAAKPGSQLSNLQLALDILLD